MNKIKKGVSALTILSICVVSLMLILLLFDVKLFGDNYSKFIITFATIGIGGFFAINSLNMINKNKLIGWISLGLIIASVVLILLSVWISFGSDLYSKIMISLGLLSVLFNIIVSSGLSLGRSRLVWQIIVYFIVALTDIISTLAIFGVIKLLAILPWFLTLIILSVVGVIILKVLSKKTDTDLVTDKNYIKITKEEYDELLEKAKKYDELMKSKENN